MLGDRFLRLRGPARNEEKDRDALGSCVRTPWLVCPSCAL